MNSVQLFITGISTFLSVSLFSFAVSGLGAYPILSLLRRWKSHQTISDHAPETHQLKSGTPTMGGLIVLLGLLAALAVNSFGHRAEPLAQAAALLVLGFGLIGFLDDYVVPKLIPGKRGLGWIPKLLLQFVMAAAPLLILDFGPHIEPKAALIFVILFCCNAYNFSDGLDGLAATIGLIILGALCVICSLVGLPSEICLVAGALFGALLPFYMVNAHPAKAFMGDVGSLPIGAVMGLLLYALGTYQYQSDANVELHRLLPWASVILGTVLILELVPVPIQIAWVKAFKRRIFPFTPIHHAFEKGGWHENRVVALFAIVQLIAAVAAILLIAIPLRILL